MPPNDEKPKNKTAWLTSLCIVVLAVAVGIMIWLNKTETYQDDSMQKPVVARQKPGEVRKPIVDSSRDRVVPPPRPDTAPPPAIPGPVADYDRLKKDKNLQAVMEKRKEKYGFEKGVDLIVTPDESVKVGDQVVPMKEILDRIRLKSGDLLEKDLTEPPAGKKAEDKRKEMISELDTVNDRYRKLERMISDPKQAQPKETKETYVKEREALGKIVSVYDDYRKTTEELEQKKELLASLSPPEKEPISPPAPSTTESAVKSGTSVDAEKAPISTGTDSGKDIGHRTVDVPAAPPPGKNPEATETPPAAQASGRNTAPKVSTTEQPSPDAVIPIPAPAPAPAIKAPVAPGTAKASRPSLRAGKRRISIEALKRELREEINTLMLKKGDLENDLIMLLKKEKRPEAYGIYVVQARDNIWNIHYKFLKEFFKHRHVSLTGNADEPDTRGRSSGVGKILKFSEKMVYIYNIREHELTTNIDLIHPLSKIVVFNMSKVFELLKDVAYKDVDKIQFDGENIWLPAKS